MPELRIGVVTGKTSWLHKQKLVAKYLKIRLDGVIYPDVFALPYLISNGCDFLCDGEQIVENKYDLLISELNGSDSQLDYLKYLVLARIPPVVVVPGPPEILGRELTNRKLFLVREILSEAKYVWAYSATIANFCDGLLGRRKAQVVPWPFDTAGTVRIGAAGREESSKKCRVLLNAPLRFCHSTQNFPFILKGVLLNVWNELPPKLRERITFHSFVYSREDEEQFYRTGFGDDLPIVLESKKSYCSFVRFVGNCSAVINLLYGNVLGRLTFIAAALGRPGIFSDSSEINRALYPDATVPLLTTDRLYEMVRSLLFGIAAGQIENRFLPSQKAAAEIGDFHANSLRLRALIDGGTGTLRS